MKLERYETGEHGTFGLLYLPDGMILHTLERPWEGNRPHLSSIPTGEYTLEPHSSDKYPDTWALVGETVSHYPHPGKARSVCLFHRGNWKKDTTGCTLVGMSRALEHDDMILDSAEAMETFRLAMRAEEKLPTLTITESYALTRGIVMEKPMAAEPTPSAPATGASRDLGRTLGGWIVGFLVTAAAKAGLDIQLTAESQAALAVALGSLILSPLGALLGKIDRQADGETGWIGRLF